MSEDFIGGLQADLVEAMDRYERRSQRGRIAVGLDPRRMRPAAPMRVAAAAAIIVALVGVVLTAGRKSAVERPPAAPGKQVVTNVRDGIRFSLDGRVLTVHLLASAPSQTIRRVSGVRTSVSCGANGASPPSDSGATTLTQHWPAGQMSLSYRFRRDVSGWCRLEAPVGRSVAFVVFPGAGALETINDIANAWLYWPRLGRGCGYSQGLCEGLWRGAMVQEIAIRGDRATVKFSNGETIELHRDANGVWLTDLKNLPRPGARDDTAPRAE